MKVILESSDRLLVNVAFLPGSRPSPQFDGVDGDVFDAAVPHF